MSTRSTSPARKIVVKNSRIHGRGVYAGRDLDKGERVIEYKGELITWKECDRRPPSDPNDPFHTFFFSLSNGKHVIDASVGGNDARWINHSCNPNCEAEEDEEENRVFIITKRAIKLGEELNYDYGLILDERITPTLKKNYECRCGSKNCRGTMLALKSKPKAAKTAKAANATKKQSKADAATLKRTGHDEAKARKRDAAQAAQSPASRKKAAPRNSRSTV